MTFQDYVNEVIKDACEAIDDGVYDYVNDADDLTDEMWCDDSITGNGSGSYTFNTWKAQQNVSDVIWDEEFLNELDDMCVDLGSLMKDGAEAVDVTARCVALTGEAAQSIIDHFNMRKDKASHVWRISLIGGAYPYLITATYEGHSREVETAYEYAARLDEVFDIYNDLINQ